MSQKTLNPKNLAALGADRLAVTRRELQEGLKLRALLVVQLAQLGLSHLCGVGGMGPAQ